MGSAAFALYPRSAPAADSGRRPDPAAWSAPWPRNSVLRRHSHRPKWLGPNDFGALASFLQSTGPVPCRGTQGRSTPWQQVTPGRHAKRIQEEKT